MRKVVLAVFVATLGWAGSARAEVVWLCNPALASDACRIGQDTTYQGPPDKVVTPPQGERAIDCFYVYPTVSNQATPNATKSHDPELDSIAKYQAARFNTQCRIFAPIYRQATLLSIQAGGADREIAYADVLEAWREYLRRDNQGRGVVLIGHSQGTAVLRRLIKTEVETHPGQLRKVVGGILLGGNVTVPVGKTVGGDFQRLPLCTQRAQVACIVAYSTFATDPPANSRFGRSNPPAQPNPANFVGGPGYEVACTDPRPLAGVAGEPLHILTPSEMFAPGPIAAGIAVTSGGVPPSARTTWVVPPDRAQGGCKRINGAYVLRYDPVNGSRRPNYFPDATWGTHLLDVNLGLDPLVSLVSQQERRWVHPHIGIRASCRSHRVRVRVIGSERSFVSAKRVRLFKGRVRATLKLRQGAPLRLTQTTRRPRCSKVSSPAATRGG